MFLRFVVIIVFLFFLHLFLPLLFFFLTPIRNLVRKALPHLLFNPRSEPNIFPLPPPLSIPRFDPFLSEIRGGLKDPIYTACRVDRVGREECNAFRESIAEFPGTER